MMTDTTTTGAPTAGTTTAGKVLYSTTATATGGREGRSATEDGRLDVTVSVPRELGGPGAGTNPEQLFAAGYAACFHSALTLVARKAKADISGSSVTAKVALAPSTAGIGYGLQVDLAISLPGVDREIAEQLVRKADAVCPYSNGIRGNVPLTHQLV